MQILISIQPEDKYILWTFQCSRVKCNNHPFHGWISNLHDNASALLHETYFLAHISFLTYIYLNVPMEKLKWVLILWTKCILPNSFYIPSRSRILAHVFFIRTFAHRYKQWYFLDFSTNLYISQCTWGIKNQCGNIWQSFQFKCKTRTICLKYEADVTAAQWRSQFSKNIDSALILRLRLILSVLKIHHAAL